MSRETSGPNRRRIQYPTAPVSTASSARGLALPEHRALGGTRGVGRVPRPAHGLAASATSVRRQRTHPRRPRIERPMDSSATKFAPRLGFGLRARRIICAVCMSIELSKRRRGHR